MQGHIACMRFTAARHDVLPGQRGSLESNGIAIAGGEFDHDYSIRAGRHRRASHDLHATSRGQRQGDAVPGLDLACAAQLRSCCRFAGAYRVAIARGAVERRVLAVRPDLLCQDVTQRLPNVQLGSGHSARPAASLRDHNLPGFVVAQHEESPPHSD